MEYVRYNEVSLYRGSFPYCYFTITRANNIAVYFNENFVIGSSLYRGSTVSVERREANVIKTSDRARDTISWSPLLLTDM